MFYMAYLLTFQGKELAGLENVSLELQGMAEALDLTCILCMGCNVEVVGGDVVDFK